SENLYEQLSDARPVIFNTTRLYAIIPSDESRVDVKLRTFSGESGGIAVPDSPLTTINSIFAAAASPGDARSMATQYARVLKLAPEDPMRWYFRFEVDREIDEGLEVTLPGNTTPTRIRLFLYAQGNAQDPQLREELSQLYKNPHFHFQFSLALYYEIMGAQARLLAAGARRIREITIDTAATRARVSGLLDAPRAQAVSMGVVGTSTGLMSKHSPARQHQKGKETNKLRLFSATSDPRLPPVDPRAQPVVANTPARLRTESGGLGSVPMTRGAEISLPGSSQPGEITSVSSAGVTTASATLGASSLGSNTSPSTNSPPSPAAKEQRQVKFTTPQTPPTTPQAPPTPNTTSGPSLLPRSGPGARFTSQHRFSPLERHIANSHKRQHSSPSSSSSGSAGRQRINYIRQNPTFRQNYDWRAQDGTGASSSNGAGNLPSAPGSVATCGVRSSPGSSQTSTNYYASAPYPSIPPPFSWDHIVHTRSRATVYNPPSQNNNANTGTTSAPPQASVLPPPYVPSSKPQQSYADVVFGRSGASTSAPTSTLLPSAPLRTG
ncbi:hypothetical protein P7C70_g9324, partial [Phenoliferia sp. Uapishka_3]